MRQCFELGQLLLLWLGFNIPHDQHCLTVGSISDSLLDFNNLIPLILVEFDSINFLASRVLSIAILKDLRLFIIIISLTFYLA